MCERIKRVLGLKREPVSPEDSRLVMRLVTRQLTDPGEIREAQKALARMPQRIIW